MTLNIAIQMDAVEHLRVASDSTLLLGLEAQKRGYRLYYYQPWQLMLKNGVVMAHIRPVTFYRDRQPHYSLGEEVLVELTSMDVVLMRNDPPFDMAYLTATYHLERIHPRTLVVNNPKEVRDAPEKLLVCNFPELMPPTLITQDIAALKAFRREYQDIILKPLYAHGGRDVFRVKADDANFTGIVDVLQKLYPCPMIAQQFLPEIAEGDKRIILVDGEPQGCLARIPADGEIRSNLVAGGSAIYTELTERDREICAAIGPELKQRGLLFAGIDVIGRYITEINVTSPTGLPSINRLSNACVEAVIWDAIEARLG